MDILEFLEDDRAQFIWLERERLVMEEMGDFFSWWPHGRTQGFGAVVTGSLSGRSMELHLMPGGEVSRHLEEFDQRAADFVTLVSDSVMVETLEDLSRVYIDLRERTRGGS